MQDDLLPLATAELTLSNQASLGLQCNQLENISIIVLILVDLRSAAWRAGHILPRPAEEDIDLNRCQGGKGSKFKCGWRAARRGPGGDDILCAAANQSDSTELEISP